MKFLNVLGELKRSNNGEFQPFLSEAYNKGVPETGASLKLFYNGGINVSCLLKFSRVRNRVIHFILGFFLALRLPATITVSIAQYS